MPPARLRNTALALAAAAALLAGPFDEHGLITRPAAAQSGASTGPSSSQSPYVIPTVTDVTTRSILTVGDSVNNKPDGVTPYRMVGIPDGLGAFDNGDGTFTILMNQEIGATAGVTRAHGSAGSFVSKWIVRKSDLGVVRGDDLIQQVATWNAGMNAFNAPAQGVAIGRLCSADLPELSAFYNAASGNGHNGRIYMDGEETGAEGRAFGHLLNGTSYELPRLGKFSWENSVAHPSTGDKTLVIGTDDSTPGQVYLYVGDKTAVGNAVERAGLTNGSLYGVRVSGIAVEGRTAGVATGTAFDLVNFGDVSAMTGATLQTSSAAAQVTEFLRPEDGAWDPQNPNDFYFVTTDRFDTLKAGTGTQVGRSRLYRLRFNNVAVPTLGGRVDMLLDGSEPQQMFDNLTIDRRGQIYLQEDPGGQPHLAKIWRYSISHDTLTLVARHDPARFTQGLPGFLTIDEEASGIIDVSHILGDGWFLLDVQAHYPIAGELVEGGQLLAMRDQAFAPGGATSTVLFTAGDRSVSEGAGSVTLAAARTGDTTQAASVEFRTDDAGDAARCDSFTGTASQRCDYGTAQGTLTFAAGQTQASIVIPITDDAFAEGAEVFNVTLSNAVGTSFGGQSAVRVTITDNDAATAAANPIDNSAFFVSQHYRDFLGRDPEATGLAAWLAVLNGCAAGNTTCDRVAVSSSFFRSPEFEQKGYFLYRFYAAAYGRRPTYREFTRDLLRLSGATAQEVETRKTEYANEFAARTTFTELYNSLTNTEYVAALFNTAGIGSLARITRPDGSQFTRAQLADGSRTRAGVLREIVESREVSALHFNRAFVAAEYFGYLKRDPDEAGYQMWLAVIDANPTNFRLMVGGFLNSVEYRLRFGNP